MRVDSKAIVATNINPKMVGGIQFSTPLIRDHCRGDHVEGMRLMDIHNWKNNVSGGDKRSLLEVPIIKKEYGTNLMLILPPKSCKLKELNNRCTVGFYYKQIEKFMQLVSSG
ncbi:LOW QUALITY PROTEIN: hypothetical protein YC2023_007831 [Brassica napus]